MVPRRTVCKFCLVLFPVVVICVVFMHLRKQRPLPFPGAVVEYPELEDVPMLIQEDAANLQDVTVVTAFINIGRFSKGSTEINVTKETYLDWMVAFRYLTNPVVVYTDTPEVQDWFINKRSRKNTRVIPVSRESIWPFQFLDAIQKIYDDPDYLIHYPNTVNPLYTCSQHAKYTFVKQAIDQNYFNTRYFSWTDLGYFRGIVKRKKTFRLSLPPNFNEKQVSYNLINSTSLDLTPEYIFRNNIVRYAGGFFVGSKQSLEILIDYYTFSFEEFLNRNLSNTDQQVLYSMYTASHSKLFTPPISLQEYVSVYQHSDWFYLGYLCLREQPT